MREIDHLHLRQRLGMELFSRMRENTAALHPLRQLFWECTLRCNLHCRHCGSDCKQSALHPDMPLKDFLKVLDSVAKQADAHKVFVVITGGEPLMRSDLEACGREIYRRGFPWGMVTNALFLTPQRFEALLQSGMHTMTVSLDGLRENHSWLRGNLKSFDRVAQALDLMRQSRLAAYDVVTCVNQRNYAELPSIRDFLISKGVPAWRLFTVFPVGRAAHDPEMKLQPDQLRGLMEFIKQTRKEKKIKANYGCEGFLGRYEGEVRDSFFHCNAGLTVASVLVDGSISACSSIRSNYHQGNIYQDDFMYVWNYRFEKYRNRQWMKTGACADCRFWRFCKGNGMHLRDDEGRLLLCQLKELEKSG